MFASTRFGVSHLFAVAVAGALAVLIAGLPVPRLTAQEASPAVPADIPPLLVAWAEAWSAGNPDQLVALYADDAVYEEIPTGTVARGAAEIRAFVAASQAGLADLQVTPVAGFRAGDRAVLEGIFSGKAGDRAISVPFVAVFALTGERIAHSRDYYDLYTVMVQSGALPAPAGAGTPTG